MHKLEINISMSRSYCDRDECQKAGSSSMCISNSDFTYNAKIIFRTSKTGLITLLGPERAPFPVDATHASKKRRDSSVRLPRSDPRNASVQHLWFKCHTESHALTLSAKYTTALQVGQGTDLCVTSIIFQNQSTFYSINPDAREQPPLTPPSSRRKSRVAL